MYAIRSYYGADYLVALLDGAGTADVDAHRGVELQRVATGGGFGAAEHHANFHANLVDEHHQAIGIFDVTGDFTQRLRHQTGLESYNFV